MFDYVQNFIAAIVISERVTSWNLTNRLDRAHPLEPVGDVNLKRNETTTVTVEEEEEEEDQEEDGRKEEEDEEEEEKLV